MQAIITTVIPHTNTRPTRIRAKCKTRKIIVPCYDSINIEYAHRGAAISLCEELLKEIRDKYGPEAESQSVWNQNIITGCLPGKKGYCHVPIPPGYVLTKLDSKQS